MTSRLVITIVLCFSSVSEILTASKIPKEFHLCRRSTPDFAQCLKPAIENTFKSIAGGTKELGLPVLEPLFVPSISIESNGLSLYYEDCLISGWSTPKYLENLLSLDKDNCYAHSKTIVNSTMKAKYRVSGKLMLFQLEGHGNANITLINLVAWHNISCAFYEKDGLEFLNVTNWVEDYKPEKVLYDFDNLIDGNAELSAQILQVINENDLDVFQNVRSDYEKVYASISLQLANNVFSKFPWREIFLD